MSGYYRTMRDEYDFDNVGTVIQAYLRRTENDINELASEGSRIRLCKGAYVSCRSFLFPFSFSMRICHGF